LDLIWTLAFVVAVFIDDIGDIPQWRPLARSP